MWGAEPSRTICLVVLCFLVGVCLSGSSDTVTSLSLQSAGRAGSSSQRGCLKHTAPFSGGGSIDPSRGGSASRPLLPLFVTVTLQPGAVGPARLVQLCAGTLGRLQISKWQRASCRIALLRLAPLALINTVLRDQGAPALPALPRLLLLPLLPRCWAGKGL